MKPERENYLLRHQVRISQAELERRWTLLRERMDAKGIDALVAMSNDRELHCGYARWITGEPFGYTVAVVFHCSDLMTRVEHGPGDMRTLGGDEIGYRGVGTVRKTPEFCAVNYSHLKLVSEVVDDLAKRGYRRVGLIGLDRMTYAMVDAIKTALTGKAEIVDETEFVDQLIAIKGPEELALMRENVTIQTAAFNKLLAEIRPGMRDIDMENLARSECYSLGGTGGPCHVGSMPMGRPAFFVSRNPQRKVQKGDQVTILIETTGPDGYFTEVGRTIVLGRASNELHEASAIATEALSNVRRSIKVGGSFQEIIDAHNNFMMSRNLPPERRVLAHGSGYDVVQRPLIREDETMLVAENMFFAIHPTFANDKLFGWMCDNFIIESGGASETLHDVPQRIFEVDC